MVLVSSVQEQRPVGGSSLARTYLNHLAFDSFAFAGRNAATATRSTVTGMMLPPKPSTAAVLPQTCNLQSHLRRTYSSTQLSEKQVGRRQDDYDFVETFTDPKVLIPGLRSDYHVPWAFEGPDMSEKLAIREKARQLEKDGKPRWFPKDVMEQTQPRTILYKWDPYYQDHPTPFEIQNTFGAHPAPPLDVPPRYRSWTSEQEWSDPWNHAHFKITGKPMARTQSGFF